MMSGSVVNASYAHAPQGAAPIAHAAWPSPSSGHHAETRHPGTADAAHRHARAGLRERNGPKPTRGARATRPATSQHRVGRGAGEAAAHLACESVLEGFRQRKLRCRYFATRGWGLLSSPGRGSACRNSAQTCGPSFAARSRREIDGQLANSRLAVKLQATISRDK